MDNGQEAEISAVTVSATMAAPGAPTIKLDDALRDEYGKLWQDCTILPEHEAEVKRIAVMLIPNAARYRAVQLLAQVPWQVVAALHYYMDEGLSFDRPVGAGIWETAIAAELEEHQIAHALEGGMSELLFRLECYFGLGYRRFHPDSLSPQLWAGTNRQTRGAYDKDRRFDPELLWPKPGVAAILRALEAAGHDMKPALARAPGGAPPYPKHILRQGSDDRRNVRQVQTRLNEVGCGPVDVDGFFGDETEEAVCLFQSRTVDDRGVPLDVDGEVGPKSWAALFGATSVVTSDPESITDVLVRKALEVAVSQIGVREVGTNNGPEVTKYLASVGLGPGYAWCAAFVHYCFQTAAAALSLENPLVHTGHCLTHWREAGEMGIRRVTAAQAREDPSLVRPGQIFIVSHGGGRGHTGIVERVQGATLVTIEGNTNVAGSREGDGVYRREGRSLDARGFMGFIDYARAP